MKVIKIFRSSQNQHYMPVIWLSLADQIVIIGNLQNNRFFS